MKYIISLLLLLTFTAQAQKVSTFPNGTVDNAGYVYGIRLSGGVWSSYKFSLPDIKSYITPSVLGQNIANTSLTAIINGVNNWAGHSTEFDRVSSWRIKDATNVYDLLSLGFPGSVGTAMIFADPATNTAHIQSLTRRSFVQVDDGGSGTSFNVVGGLNNKISGQHSATQSSIFITTSSNGGDPAILVDSANGVEINSSYFLPAQNGSLNYVMAMTSADHTAFTELRTIYTEPIYGTVDADFTIPDGNSTTYLTNSITANRVVHFPTVSSGNPVVKLMDLNATGFHWSIFGGVASDCAGAPVVILTNGTPYWFQFNGSYWLKIN